MNGQIRPASSHFSIADGDGEVIWAGRFLVECIFCKPFFKLAERLVEKNGFENTEENAVLKSE